jgi:hypothetical protein
MAVGYRMWLYGPVLVLASLFIGRCVEDKHTEDVKPWESNSGAVLKIPFMMGGVMPVGQIFTIIGGFIFIFKSKSVSETTSWTNWALFIVSQGYMLMPYLVVLKTSYGVEIGMPMGAVSLIVLIVWFSHESLLRIRLDSAIVKLFICAGIAIVTAGYIMLFFWITDDTPRRIIVALSVAVVGALAIEIGIFKSAGYSPEKEPLLTE